MEVLLTEVTIFQDEIREEAYVLEVELEKTRKLLQMKDLELQRMYGIINICAPLTLRTFCFSSMGTLKAMDHEIMLTKEYIDSSNMARQQISTVCGDRMRYRVTTCYYSVLVF